MVGPVRCWPTLRYRIHVLSDLSKNPLLQYMARLAPSSQQTMRYILQDAADRLGFVDCNIVDVPWHRLEPGHVIALVAALRAEEVRKIAI